MGFSRQEYWSGLPFPSPMDYILSDLSTMTRPSWVALQARLGFIDLDKAVVLVWLDSLVFCEYGFSVSALWCPLATLTILLGFLLPWVWGTSSQLLQQSTATAPYLGWGVSPYHHRSWPSTWDSSSIILFINNKQNCPKWFSLFSKSKILLKCFYNDLCTELATTLAYFILLLALSKYRLTREAQIFVHLPKKKTKTKNKKPVIL